MGRLLKNSIQTPDGTILVSYVTGKQEVHSDLNGHVYTLSGGTDYQHIDVSEGGPDPLDISVYDDGTHELRREHLCWADFGFGQQEPKMIPVKNMKTSFINGLIEKAALGKLSISDFLMDVLVTELTQR